MHSGLQLYPTTAKPSVGSYWLLTLHSPLRVNISCCIRFGSWRWNLISALENCGRYTSKATSGSTAPSNIHEALQIMIWLLLLHYALCFGRTCPLLTFAVIFTNNSRSRSLRLSVSLWPESSIMLRRLTPFVTSQENGTVPEMNVVIKAMTRLILWWRVMTNFNHGCSLTITETVTDK